MWKFAPPYKLKQLIDLVAQRRYLFSYDGKQYGPMLNVAKAVAIYSRGSRFLEDSAIPASRFDHQAPYIDFWLELIGVQSLRSVVVDNAWNESAEESAQSLANGKARLIDMTEWFLA
jgi:FMN-dependent NADH-azoreductase